MSNPNPPADRAFPAPPVRWRRAWWVAGAGLLLAYVLLVGRQATTVAGGADSSGYFNSARLLHQGRLRTEVRAPAEFGPREALHPWHFTPLGFAPARIPGQLTPTYPAGLPLHLAAAGAWLGARTGAMLVLLLAAGGAVALCALVARELGLAWPLAAAGAVILGVFPVFLFTAVQPLSDTLATMWTLAALYTALRARARPGWAAAAGGAFAVAVLVRPTNLLLAPALLVLLLLRPGAEGRGLILRRLGLFLLGGLPGAAWLAWYNHSLYGHALSSGYGDIFSAFGWRYGGPTAVHFAKWLALLLPPIVLVLPLAVAARRELRRAELLALALLFGAIVGCYLFYEVSHEVWWCLRFILPALPALILAALLGVEALARGPGARWPRAFRPAAAGALALWAGANSWYWSTELAVFEMKRYEQAYATGAHAARERLPAGAVVACNAFSGALYYYTDYAILRFDQMEAAVFARYAAQARGAGRAVTALLFDSEEAEAFRRCPGRWTLLARIGGVSLWQLAGDAAGG